MKAGLLCLAALSAAATAQPHRRQHHHHAKRDVVVVTDVIMATATAPAAVVYVDANGNPISTSYVGQPQSSPTAAAIPASSIVAYTPPPAPTAASSSYIAPAPASTSETPAASDTSSVAPPVSSSVSSSSSGSSLANSGYTISYSPYNNDNTCKNQTQVDSDFEAISDFAMVRLYGTDCNQTATVLSAASAKGINVFAGVYDVTQVDSEVQDIIDAAKGNWNSIHTVAIGNEGVNNNVYTVAEVVSAIGAARSKLQSAGYTGNVVTVDTFVAVIANPELCQASDYAAANCHAFFDGSVTAQDAGKFVLGQAQRVSAACGGKDTIITESGWPSQGDTNGQAVPSEQNQIDAINSLKSAFSSNIVLFSAFNDYWKQNNAGTYAAEQYWGIMGNAPS
ncbi:hypothetical protein LTR36_007486 [Oleoguttula mirabilis]|uniref:Uncharacterized protein n=1 Tax=Oleoguttula mirabilis TaxID=1507867 RepID=A0AAV9JUR3_9PEZI|nr:hypothetical protein LTR36_007486 [Oleoguttula mirabilis]